MSRQLSIDTYFKTKSNLPPSGTKVMNENSNGPKKRRSLSLVKTPTTMKTPKLANPEKKQPKNETEVICLSSDDENLPSATQEPKLGHIINNISEESDPNSSQATIIYTLTPQTPVKTPQKTSKTPQGTGDSFQSPNSKKFYSPAKKRSVTKRTPVKRNLARESFIQPRIYADDEMFKQACEGMDDKSKHPLVFIGLTKLLFYFC